MFKKLNIFLISLIFIFFTTLSMSEDKVGFIDLDYVIKNSNPGKLALENISSLDQQNVAVLKKKNKELIKYENEIKNKQNIISKEAFEEEVKLLRNKINKFSKEKDDMVKNFNNYKKTELDMVFKKITPIIRKYMDDNSITILLDSKNIFMGKVEVDLTEKILVNINKSIN